MKLSELQRIKAADNHDDLGFNSFFKYGWKRFYLKWYGTAHPSAAELCPQSVAILKSIPTIKAAMFAELPPGGKLNRHRDPYAGSLRYHLGLVTPNDDACYIEVDGERHSWRDGQGVVFDVNGDGQSERTGWISSQDGLLARDLNGDGQINDGSELFGRSEAHTSELQSHHDLVCRLLLEKKKRNRHILDDHT